MRRFSFFLIVFYIFGSVFPIISYADTHSENEIEVLIMENPNKKNNKRDQRKNKTNAIEDSLNRKKRNKRDRTKRITDRVYSSKMSRKNHRDLERDNSIITQVNRYKSVMTTNAVLDAINITAVHGAPYNATGTGYAIAVVDTGIRGTHNFFTESGEAYDSDTNPSRLTVEHCQSAGFPITDETGEYILDGSGNKLYEGISTCKGNIFEPTEIDGFTYYSNTIPGTVAPSFGAAEPCLGEYPGFNSTGCSHGTHVAGIATGTSAEYADSLHHSGIAPTSNVIAFNVFTKYTDPSICGGSSCLLAIDADILSALAQIEELAVAGTKIAAVNMSIGGDTYDSEAECKADNLLYYYYFERLKNLGIPVIVASGNGGYKNKITAPACISTAYSVASVSTSDVLSSFSNVSSFLDFLAPGSGISSSYSNDVESFISYSGTSMATPVVSGAFGVLIPLFDGTVDGYPKRSTDAIAGALKETGVLIDDTRSGGTVTDMPRINVLGAITFLLESPYISIPDSLDISYPLTYEFTVSGPNTIDSADIVLTGNTTASTDSITCAEVSSIEYNCSVTISSSGIVQLEVSDSETVTYTTPQILFQDLPSVQSVNSTRDTGTYITGDDIDITLTISGNDSPLTSSSSLSIEFNNGVVLDLTRATSTTFTGTYTVGTENSGEDTDHLYIVSITNVDLYEQDGTHLLDAYFTLDADSENNLGQSGKVITIDVTPEPEPEVIAPVPTSSGGGGGGGGGGGSPAPAIPTVEELQLFCQTTITSPINESSNPTVIYLAESALKRMGFFGSLPNQNYNSATTLAVTYFQYKYSPSAITGVIDIPTWELIKFYGGCGTNENKKSISLLSTEKLYSANVAIPQLEKTLTTKDSSPIAKELKVKLKELKLISDNVRLTEKYTFQLRVAVARFQKKHGLRATGYTDQATLNLIYSSVI